MPVFIFKGRVLPEFYDLTIHRLPVVTFNEAPYLGALPEGLNMKCRISIDHSRIDLTCDVKQSNVEMSWIHNRVINYVRALVDLHCFAKGDSLSVILDSVTTPDGLEGKILITSPQVRGICTVTSSDAHDQDIHHISDKALEKIIAEPALFLAMRDLISGVSYPNLAAIDCARAVEGLRVTMCGDPDDKKSGWEALQSSLRVSREYLQFITRASEKPRHGNWAYIPKEDIDEITRRAWTVMNRFLVLRSRGVSTLPEDEFPTL